jgi:pimeloyl-ACP methyl ester carboxylesterase
MTRTTELIAAALLLALGGTARAEKPADPLAKAPSHFAQSDNIRVHYKTLGRGKTTLVFVHGWTCDMTFWRSQVGALAGKVRLVLIDLPGHGQSDKPKVDYTMDRFARAVNAVMKDAGVERAVLVGHSMGSPVIQKFYHLFPKKTQALIVADGAVFAPKLDPARLKGLKALLEGADYKKNLAKMFDRMFTRQAPVELRARAKAVSARTPQHVVVSAMQGMYDKAAWSNDPIKVPLLMIMAKSGPWPADYEKFARKLDADLDYHKMDGVGHFLMLEKPDIFNQIVVDFLAKHHLVNLD